MRRRPPPLFFALLPLSATPSLAPSPLHSLHSLHSLTQTQGVPDDWALGNEPMVPLQSLLMGEQRVDVVVEVARIPTKDIRLLQMQHGTRVVSYRPGEDFQTSLEAMTYNHTSDPEMYTSQGYDGIFVTQSTSRSSGFLEIVLNSTAHHVPLVWSPRLYNHVASSMPDRKHYQPTVRCHACVSSPCAL